MKAKEGTVQLKTCHQNGLHLRRHIFFVHKSTKFARPSFYYYIYIHKFVVMLPSFRPLFQMSCAFELLFVFQGLFVHYLAAVNDNCKQRKNETFVECSWSLLQGIAPQRIHPQTVSDGEGGSMIGMMAVLDISRGSPILNIPEYCVISRETASDQGLKRIFGRLAKYLQEIRVKVVIYSCVVLLLLCNQLPFVLF